MQRPVIVKIGGSLFDLPYLGAHLVRYLAKLNTSDVLVVPGGGSTTDLVRSWDRTFQLGEERSHWLALRGLALSAHFLASLLPRADVIAQLEDRLALAAAGVTPIVDMYAWARADEASPDHLPHSWDVTSDSLAVRLALVSEAAELIVLKSVDFSGQDWQQAAAADIVDPFFPEIMERGHGRLRVQILNFRRLSLARD